MMFKIAMELNNRIVGIPWIAKHAGLVRDVTRDEIALNENNEPTVLSSSTFPIASGADGRECWESGRYTDLMPSDAHTSVAFWRETTPLAYTDDETLPRGFQRWAGALRLIVWADMQRIGYVSDWQINHLIVDILRQYSAGEQASTRDARAIRLNESGYESMVIEYQPTAQIINGADVWSGYTVGDIVESMLYPFATFAVDFDVSVVFNPQCTVPLVTTPIEC